MAQFIKIKFELKIQILWVIMVVKWNAVLKYFCWPPKKLTGAASRPWTWIDKQVCWELLSLYLLHCILNTRKKAITRYLNSQYSIDIIYPWHKSSYLKGFLPYVYTDLWRGTALLGFVSGFLSEVHSLSVRFRRSGL